MLGPLNARIERQRILNADGSFSFEGQNVQQLRERAAEMQRQRLERAADAVRTRSLQQAEVADMLQRLADRDVELQSSWGRD